MLLRQICIMNDRYFALSIVAMKNTFAHIGSAVPKVIVVILLAPIIIALIPFALISGAFQTRKENQLQRQFVQQWHGEKIGVLAYTNSRPELQAIIDGLDPKLAKRLIIVKNGGQTDELSSQIIDDYMPDFDANGPFGEPDDYANCPFVDLRLIVLNPEKGGTAHHLVYHDEELSEKRVTDTTTEINSILKESAANWNKSSARA